MVPHPRQAVRADSEMQSEFWLHVPPCAQHRPTAPYPFPISVPSSEFWKQRSCEPHCATMVSLPWIRCVDPLLPSHGPVISHDIIRSIIWVVTEIRLMKLKWTWVDVGWLSMFNTKSNFWEWLYKWATIQDGGVQGHLKHPLVPRAGMPWNSVILLLSLMASAHWVQTDWPGVGQLCLSGPSIFSVSPLTVWVPTLERGLAGWKARTSASWYHSFRKGRPTKRLPCEEQYSCLYTSLSLPLMSPFWKE